MVEIFPQFELTSPWHLLIQTEADVAIVWTSPIDLNLQILRLKKKLQQEELLMQ